MSSCVSLNLNPGASSSCLPEDMIVEIGTRLPFKSIGRCRSVQKPWNSALSSPLFIDARVSKETDKKVLLRSYSDPSILYGIQFDTKNRTGNATNLWCSCDRVVGSCKSLILTEKCECLSVMNPLTKTAKQLAPPLSKFCEETKHSHYGLCFDKGALDHCVVEISWYTRTPEESCWIDWYSRNRKAQSSLISHCYVKVNRWDEATPTGFDFDVPYQKSGLLYDRKLHWIAWDNNDSYVIIAYNVSNRQFRILPAPDDNVFEDEGYKLFPAVEIVLGCLGLITGDFWAGVELWVMKKYGEGESWMKLPILLDYMDTLFVPVDCPENVLIIEDKHEFKLLDLDVNGKEVTTHDVHVSGMPKRYKYVGTWMEGLAKV